MQQKQTISHRPFPDSLIKPQSTACSENCSPGQDRKKPCKTLGITSNKIVQQKKFSFNHLLFQHSGRYIYLSRQRSVFPRSEIKKAFAPLELSKGRFQVSATNFVYLQRAEHASVKIWLQIWQKAETIILFRRKSTMNIGYDCIPIMQECYNALYDDLSKQLFFARMAADIDSDSQQAGQLAALSGYGKNHLQAKAPWLAELAEDQTPIYLYGAGLFGAWWRKVLLDLRVNVKGFLDQKYETLSTYLGLPVLPPPILNKKWKETLEPASKILVTVGVCEDEIISLLDEAGVSKERVLPRTLSLIMDVENQYFDFMDHVPESGIFVDGGCFDLGTSIRFSNLRNNPAARIIAFEPDSQNHATCEKKLNEHHLTNAKLVQAGLWSESTTLHFHGDGTGTSSFTDNGEISVPVVALDEITNDEKVAFIKMDIEGSELAALQGASNTIHRDKPFCAICIYHKPGDMLAISHFLKQLVPDYKFAIRHYSSTIYETVLYAFI